MIRGELTVMTLLLIAAVTAAIAIVHTAGRGCETRYAPTHRAELQNKIDGLVPLSIADLGELE